MITTLGQRIRFHRERLGLRQEELADKMGVSPKAISFWENDRSYPRSRLLTKLSDILHVPLSDLATGKETSQNASLEGSILPVSDNSMSPTIRDGDRVLLKDVTTSPADYHRKVVLVSIDGEKPQLYRLFVAMGIEGPEFLLSKDCPSKPPVNLGKRTMKILGEVSVVLRDPQIEC